MTAVSLDRYSTIIGSQASIVNLPPINPGSPFLFGLSCCLATRRENCHQLRRFHDKSLDRFARRKFGLEQQLEPVQCFVRLFFGHTDLCHELGARPRPARSPIVRTRRCRGANDLPCNNLRHERPRQRADQRDDLQSKMLGSDLELLRRHAPLPLFVGNPQSSIHNRQSKIVNRQSPIVNRHRVPIL